MLKIVDPKRFISHNFLKLIVVVALSILFSTTLNLFDVGVVRAGVDGLCDPYGNPATCWEPYVPNGSAGECVLCQTGGQFCPWGYHFDKTVCVRKCKDGPETCRFRRGRYVCESEEICYCSSDYPCVPDVVTCTNTNPTAPGLTAPSDGYNIPTGMSVDLSWGGAAFGTGCPSNTNRYLLYVEAGDSTPDTLVATLGSGTTSYSFTGSANFLYYWKVVASNGARTTDSVVRSFYTPGLVTGTLFDASEIDTCALMGSQPKISGITVNLDSATRSYSPVSNGSGVYSQYVDIPDIYTVSPVVGDPYTSTPKLICQGPTADLVTDGSTITRDFGFWRIYGGWWQVVGGDVYGGGGVESIIPNSLPGSEKYLIKENVDGADGLVYYDIGGVAELGNSSGVAVSNSGWESESGYEGQDINYAYYMAKMKTLDKTVWNGSGKPDYNPIDGYEIYTSTGDVVVNFGVTGGEKRVFMVDGNVTVNSDVTVALGSHLTVIASGTITFTDNVGEAHGWWVGDRIVIASTGNTASEIQFKGQGSFIGWSSITFGRDRGITNNTAPAEEFTYRSDLMVNAPDALKFSKFKWLEQRP